MSQCACGAKVHARGMCYCHYMRWYKLHRDEARRLLAPKHRKWKFTAEHWWSWWEDRRPDTHAKQLRTDIQMLRRTLP